MSVLNLVDPVFIGIIYKFFIADDFYWDADKKCEITGTMVYIRVCLIASINNDDKKNRRFKGLKNPLNQNGGFFLMISTSCIISLDGSFPLLSNATTTISYFFESEIVLISLYPLGKGLKLEELK